MNVGASMIGRGGRGDVSQLASALPSLVFLHGWGSDHRALAGLARRLRSMRVSSASIFPASARAASLRFLPTRGR